MIKSKAFIAGILAMGLVFGMTVIGCATTQYDVAVSNVYGVREIYIRSAGTTNWGTNMAGNLQNIDRSKFSETVDIRVIDANGFVYSKYGVPFNDAAFVETDKTRSVNLAFKIISAPIWVPLWLVFQVIFPYSELWLAVQGM